jgi:hypothetical protein
MRHDFEFDMALWCVILDTNYVPFSYMDTCICNQSRSSIGQSSNLPATMHTDDTFFRTSRSNGCSSDNPVIIDDQSASELTSLTPCDLGQTHGDDPRNTDPVEGDNLCSTHRPVRSAEPSPASNSCHESIRRSR